MNENEGVQVEEEVHDNHEDDDATHDDDVSNGSHYKNELGEKEFEEKCGFNFTRIPYPFIKCSSM